MPFESQVLPSVSGQYSRSAYLATYPRSHIEVPDRQYTPLEPAQHQIVGQDNDCRVQDDLDEVPRAGIRAAGKAQRWCEEEEGGREGGFK
jgi:hypothetical protein